MDSVFQSYIEYLPREIFTKRFGRINSIIEIEEDLSQSLRPIHYGVFRGEIDKIWGERKLKIHNVTDKIEELELKEHSLFHKPTKGNMFWGRLGGNYCSLSFDITNNQINYFQFGVDITKRESKKFVEKIIEIANNQQFIFLGSNLETFESTKEEIDKYFRNSPAYKMNSNQITLNRFLRSLAC